MLTRELGEDGFAGVEIRVTPMRTEIIIRATRTQNVLGEKGRRIRELTSVVQKRFNFPDGSVELYPEKVMNRGLCAVAQAESLRYKLLGGLAVRRACYGVLRFVMESGAKGCEVIVSGKLRAQRAKSMKFKDGYMISSGHPVNQYIDGAVRHVLLRQLDDSALDAVMKKLSPRRRTWLEFTCFTAALDKMEKILWSNPSHFSPNPRPRLAKDGDFSPAPPLPCPLLFPCFGCSHHSLLADLPSSPWSGGSSAGLGREHRVRDELGAGLGHERDRRYVEAVA